MTLVEISEREVIAAARAWYRSALPEAPYETKLYEAVVLLEERERVAAGMRTENVADVVVKDYSIEYPPMAEGQCHWEDGDGKIAKAAPGCKHVAGNLARDEVVESGNDKVAVSPGILVDHQHSPITRNPRKLSRREQEIEKRRRSDPLGRDRPDIDYSSIEDPEVR